MSDSSKLIAESLEELLAGIADGVREAQSALSEATPFDQFGRPLPSYHLPYFEFDLKVDIQTTTESSGGRRAIKFFPMSNTSHVDKGITSAISGRFVAIPPGEGLPIPQVQLSSTRLSARKHTLNIVVSNSAGELLQNAAVEVNLNFELSQQLSAADNVNLRSLGKSKLQRALLLTDAAGRASTELNIDPAVPAKASVVVTAELEQRLANIVIAAGNV